MLICVVFYFQAPDGAKLSVKGSDDQHRGKEGITMKDYKLQKVIIKSDITRRFPDPLNKIFSGDPYNIEHHILTCRATDIPSGIPVDPTNPRDQRIDYSIYKDVQKSLEDTEGPPFFHLKNKGIRIFAHKVDYDKDSRVATIHLVEGVDGMADGAHTYRIIQSAQSAGTCPKDQAVEVRVSTGVPLGMRVEISGGLNTAVQVQRSSLANLEGKFEWIKETLKDMPYAEKIAYKQNQRGEFDIREILGLLTLFKVNEFSPEKHPIEAYTSKAKCLEMYLDDPGSYEMLKPLLKDILYLYDYVQIRAPERYNEEVEGGKARAMTTIFTPKRKRGNHQFHFMGDEAPSRIWDGSLFPILGSMRYLVEQKPGEAVYSWRLDSFEEVKEFFDEIAANLVKTTYNIGQVYKKPNPVGKDQNHWDNLYKTVALHYLTRNSR